MNELQAAISELDAQEVAPGRYAIPINRAGERFGVFSDTELIRKAHGNRCGCPVPGLYFVSMPPWWKPNQRKALKVTWSSGRVDYRDPEKPCIMMGDSHCQLVTADLDTGDEVPV